MRMKQRLQNRTRVRRPVVVVRQFKRLARALAHDLPDLQRWLVLAFVCPERMARA